MTNREIATKIYEKLLEKGAGIGNASIPFIEKVLDDSIPMDAEVGMPSENSFGQWIEAKEFSMPSFGEKVLIITRNGVYDVCRYEKEYINGYTHHSFRNNNNVEKEAFKWMPLPKP